MFAVIKCRHSFCLQCIETWLNSNQTCPLCVAPSAKHQITQSIMADDMIAHVVKHTGSPSDRREYNERVISHRRFMIRQNIQNMHQSSSLTHMIKHSNAFLYLYILFVAVLLTCFYMSRPRSDSRVIARFFQLVMEDVHDKFQPLVQWFQKKKNPCESFGTLGDVAACYFPIYFLRP